MMQLKFRAIIWLVAKSENAKGWKKQKMIKTMKLIENDQGQWRGGTAARVEKEENAI